MSIAIQKIRKYFTDFGLSFLASIVVTVVSTILVNPFLAKTHSSEEFGTILTICSYVAIVSAMIGNSLNNVRLLDKSGATGEYNYLLLLSGALGTIIIVVLLITEFHSDFNTIVGISLYTIICTLNTYYIVSYRLTINYKKNLLYSIIVSVGYLAGIVLHLVVDYWPIVFIFSQFFGFGYILFSSRLPFERPKISIYTKDILKRFIFLAITTGLAQLLSVLDRIIIFPLMGADSVSVFNTASVFGKGIITLISPVAFVLLSYYVRDGFQIDRRKYWMMIILGLVASFLMLGISLFFAPFFTKLLYPTLFDAASPFIMISTISCLLYADSVLVNPAILKLCNLKWQMIIQLLYGVLYLGFGIIGIKKAGLYGFALSGIAANLFRLLFVYLLGDRYARIKLSD